MSENRKSAGIHSQPVENSSDAKPNTPKAHWCAIPGDVGGRIGMLFITVCLIKLTMLVDFEGIFLKSNGGLARGITTG